MLDVAGMLRSFHYAACARGSGRDEADAWAARLGATFLRRYWNLASRGGFLPDTENGMRCALALFALEKAFYELRYELEHRPSWAWIPVAGLRRLLTRREP